jgi:hypothetical protein
LTCDGRRPADPEEVYDEKVSWFDRRGVGHGFVVLDVLVDAVGVVRGEGGWEHFGKEADDASCDFIMDDFLVVLVNDIETKYLMDDEKA